MVGMTQREVAGITVCHLITTVQLGKIHMVSPWVNEKERSELQGSQCLTLLPSWTQSLPFLWVCHSISFFPLLSSSSCFISCCSCSFFCFLHWVEVLWPLDSVPPWGFPRIDPRSLFCRSKIPTPSSAGSIASFSCEQGCWMSSFSSEEGIPSRNSWSFPQRTKFWYHLPNSLSPQSPIPPIIVWPWSRTSGRQDYVQSSDLERKWILFIIIAKHIFLRWIQLVIT